MGAAVQWVRMKQKTQEPLRSSHTQIFLCVEVGCVRASCGFVGKVAKMLLSRNITIILLMQRLNS